MTRTNGFTKCVGISAERESTLCPPGPICAHSAALNPQAARVLAASFMQHVKRFLGRRTTPSGVEATPTLPGSRLRRSKRRRKICTDLPAELWTTIWLLLPATVRDRIVVSHVSQTWRGRAISAACLWTAFEYSELDHRGGHILNHRRQYRLDALQAFLERSLSSPFALGLNLDIQLGPREETSPWSGLMQVVDAHRHHISRLSLRCVTMFIARLLTRGSAFPMLAEAGGRLEWLRVDRREMCSPLELARITGGPGPRSLRLFQSAAWDNDWSDNYATEWPVLPGVEELGPLVLNSPDHMPVVFNIFLGLTVLDLEIKVEETDLSPPPESVLLLKHLRTLRLLVVPRSISSFWTYDVLTKVLPSSTYSIKDLKIALPCPATNREVGRPAFASFRDFNHPLGQTLSLDVSIHSHREEFSNGNLHVWTLSDDNLRRRSVALPAVLSPMATSSLDSNRRLRDHPQHSRSCLRAISSSHLRRRISLLHRVD